MNTLQGFLTKAASVTYQDLVNQYADKWNDEDAMEEMAGKAHAIAHQSGKDITQEEAEMLMALMGKKDYDDMSDGTSKLDEAAVGFANGYFKTLGLGAGASLGGLLGGTLGAGIGHFGDLSRKTTGKLALGGLLAGLLAGGTGGVLLTPTFKAAPRDKKKILKDDAENWAYYVNKYRKQGHPGMILP